MKKFTRFLCIFIAFCLTACSAATPTPDLPSPTQAVQEAPGSTTSAPPNQDIPVVVLKTENPDFALVALFENRETIVAMTRVDETGEIIDVTGAIFTAPDGRSMAFYFENGLPVRAIAEGHVIEFYNFTDTTVDIAIVAPDGTVTMQPNIPFDKQRIYKVDHKAGGGHLAIPSLEADSAEIDWMLFASTALGAFSCAATIASGGTLSLLFGISCGIFIYTAYFQVMGKEPPLLVEVGDSGTSAVSCGYELAEKQYVMAAADCGKLIIDTAKSFQSASEQTYEKQKRVVEEIKLKSSRSPIEGVLSCSDSRLTPEEKTNCGTHTYSLTETVFPACENASGGQPLPPEATVMNTFGEGVYYNGGKANSRIGANQYQSTRDDAAQDNTPVTHIFTYTFTSSGFVVHYLYIYGGINKDCYERTYTRK